MNSKDIRSRFIDNLKVVFARFQTSDHTIERIISASIAIRNWKLLLTGKYGVGKTVLANAIASRYFVDSDDRNMARVTCHQEITDADVIYAQDFVDGNIVVRPRDFLSKRIRYVNELPRSKPDFQNALLSYFSERDVVFRDLLFHVPDGLDIADMNPEDIGSDGVVDALMDRFDVQVVIPTNDYLTQQTTLVPQTLPLSSADMHAVWECVEATTIGPAEWDYLHMVNYYFNACVKDRSIASRLYQLPCESCAYQNELCAKLRTSLGSRGVQSLQRLSSALAWLDGRNNVSVQDIETALPFIYSHRIKLDHAVQSTILNPQLFLREWLAETLEVKRDHWLNAAKAKQANDLATIEKLMHHSEDLVIAWLYDKTIRLQQPSKAIA